MRNMDMKSIFSKIMCSLGQHSWKSKIKKYKVWNPGKNKYDFKSVPHRKCDRCNQQQVKIATGTGTSIEWKIYKNKQTQNNY